MSNTVRPVRQSTTIGNQQWLLPMRLVWVVTVFLALGLVIGGLPYRYQLLLERGIEAASEGFGLSPVMYATWVMTVGGLVVLSFTLISLFLAWRRSDDWMALLTSAALISVAADSSNFPQALADVQAAFTFPVAFLVALAAFLSTVLFYLFPSGRFHPKWTMILAAFLLIWTFIRPFTYSQPYYILQWPPLAYFAWVAFFYGIGIYAQLYRYNTVATDTQRQQTKWVITGFAAAAGGFILLQLLPVFFPNIGPAGAVSFGRIIEYTIFSALLLPVPLTLAIALLRYRLYDVDFVINRGLVYGALTVFLVVLMGSSLILVQRIFQTLSGGQQSVVAVGGAALAFGMLFQPLRRRLQRFVDKQFYSINIDYQNPDKLRPQSHMREEESIQQRTLGEYGQLTLIGRGGMADVYLGQHPTLGRSVAIKILPERFAHKPDFAQRFEHEAQAMAKLRHPNIVHLYDYGQAGDLQYMVMEFIRGDEIAQILYSNGRFTYDVCSSVLKDVSEALDYAHDNGIVHRDIKPANIMLERVTDISGKPYRAILMDFGIARIEGASKLTASGMVGTFDYIAPEQISGAKNVDRRADVYALGAMAFEMLTGRPPFKHRNPGSVLLAHMTKPAPDPRDIRQDVPEHAALAILRALSKSPNDRYRSAGAFYKAFARGR